MNKIFKHKRGASGLKVVCEFAKSHCSSTEKSAINAGDYVASDLKTDKTKYFISGLKTLSIATIFAVAISSIAPVKAIADVRDDYGTEDFGITYVVEGQGGLFLYSTKNKNVKYGYRGGIKDGRGKQATMLNGYIASGEQSTVVGYGARGTHNQATAVGSNTGSYGAQGTAIGNDAYATALGAVAIGNDDMHGNEQDTSTNGKKNLNVSRTYDNHPLTEEELKNDNLQQALYNVFCSKGGSAETNGQCKQDEERLKGFGLKYDETAKKYVLDDANREKAGKYSLLLAGGQGSISIGSRSISVGEGSTALGVLAKAYGDQSTALGTLSKAMGKNSFALGANSSATEENSMAFGVNSSATMKNSIAIGYGSKTDYKYSDKEAYMPGNGYAMPMAKSVGVVSVGSDGQPRRIVNLAAGAADTDAVNVSQLKALADNIGVDNINTGTDTTLRYLSVNKEGLESKKIQENVLKQSKFKEYVQLRKFKDIMEVRIKQSGNDDLYGNKKVELENKIKEIEAKYSDFENAVTSEAGISTINKDTNEETIKKTIANIEKYSETYKDKFKVNLAHNADNKGATGADALAFGYDAKASAAGGIALGAKSEAKIEKDQVGLDFIKGEKGATSNLRTLAWKSTDGAVSVGSDSVSRQITNLAAGTKDTDAVNVAQLKSLATYVSQGFNVKGKDSSNSDLSNDIKFGKTVEFASADNGVVKVTHTKENNGNSKFTFDIDKDKLKQELGNVGGGTGGATASNLKFKGDIGDFTAKNEVNIKGGVADKTKLSDNNIGVVSDNANTLNVKLAKELKNLTSAKFESATKDTTTIEGGKITLKSHDMTKRDVVLSEGGLDMGGNKITNLNTPTTDTDGANKKYVDDEVSKTHFKVDGDTGGPKDVKNGNTIKFAGDENGNIKTSITQDTAGKTTVKFALNETDLKIGKGGQGGVDGKITVAGKDNSVTIEGKDGSITAKDKDDKNSVVINGKDGSIGLTKDGTNTTITLNKDGKPDVEGANGTKMPRLTYTTPNGNGAKTHEIATLDDGLKFAGNEGDAKVKLNEKFTIKGNSQTKNDWNDFDQGENIMTKVEGKTTTIALAKDLVNLKSAIFGDPTKSTQYTKIDEQGLHLGNGGIDINHNGIDLSGKKISNLANIDDSETDDTLATNKKYVDDQIKKIANSGGNGGLASIDVMVGSDKFVIDKNNNKLNFAAGNNLEAKIDKANNTITYAMKNDVKFNDISVGGKDGTNGANGKDGNIIVKNANGDDKIGLNGKDGTIGINGKDANATITIAKGKDGLNGEEITRIVYKDKDGNERKVATLDDGLKFAGNTGEANVKLNKKFEIKGADYHKDKEWDRDFDQGRNIMTKIDGSKTTIALSKNLSGLNSATFESNSNGLIKKVRISDEGIKFETQKVGSKSEPGVSIDHDGIKAGKKAIQDVGDAVKGTDAVNKNQMEKAIKDGLKAAGSSALTFAGDSGEVKADKGKVTFAGGQTDQNKLSDKPNIGVVAKDGKLNLKLAKDIEVDSVTAKNKITVGEGTNKITIENGKISGVQSSLDPNLSDKLKNIDADTKKSDAEKAKEKKAAIQDALKKAKQDNVATVGDLKNVTNGLDSVVENVTNITNNITNITNMVANSDDKKKIDEASKAIEEYKKDQNDKNKQKAAEDAINANKIKTYNPYGKTVKNNTTIVDAIKNINERGVKFMHISDSDKVGENDDLSVNNNDSQANKKGSIGIGMNAVSDGTDAIATGTDSKASGTNAIAMGKGAQAMGENTISIGTGNKVTGKNSGAIGDPTEIINADGTYSVGNNNNIKGGDKTTAKDIFALGNDIGSKTTPITDKANGSVILGSKGYSNVKNGVALGYGSNADRGTLADKTSAYNGDDKGVQDTIKGTYGAVSVGDKDNTRQITNVAAGSADSDAVNVAQLKAATSKIIASTGGVSMSNVTIDPKTGKKVTITDDNRANYAPKVTNDGVNSVAIGANSVANRPNTVSVGSAGNERIISNVADGVAPTDAANMRQLQSVANMVGEVKKDAMAGTASAMAIGNLPQATIPGKGMMAVGVGFYKGEQATALGVSKMSENGKWVFKASASYDSQRNVGAAGAIGFHF